ncbi:glycosyl transferase [Turicibacter sanguinis]|nr:glycosyl transferase [Turicibacter sanguinis]
MIPKIIHFCWFGKNEMPIEIQTCIDSWKKHLPSYEFILWNEENFDINSTLFTKQAYEVKKYAFVSDYVRLYALNKYGGIYLDTDQEIVKPIDEFLSHRMVTGFDDGNGIISCFIGAEKAHPCISNLLDFYGELNFINSDGSYNEIPNTIWIQNLMKEKYGLVLNGKNQVLIEGIHIYSEDFFHCKSLITGKINVTKNTYAIHHHTLLWVSRKTLIIKFIRQNIIVPIIGKNRYLMLSNLIKGVSNE